MLSLSTRAAKAEVFARLFQKAAESGGRASGRAPQSAESPVIKKIRKGVWGKPYQGVFPNKKFKLDTAVIKSIAVDIHTL